MGKIFLSKYTNVTIFWNLFLKVAGCQGFEVTDVFQRDCTSLSWLSCTRSRDKCNDTWLSNSSFSSPNWLRSLKSFSTIHLRRETLSSVIKHAITSQKDLETLRSRIQPESNFQRNVRPVLLPIANGTSRGVPAPIYIPLAKVRIPQLRFAVGRRVAREEW